MATVERLFLLCRLLGRCTVITTPVVYVYRVERRDLLGAISYALRAEVPLHAIISGSTYTSLLNFVSLLEQVTTPSPPL